MSNIALCRRCASDTLPRGIQSSSLARNALRSAAKGMARPLDPKAERIRVKKERAALRHTLKHSGPVAAAKFFITGMILPPVSEECPDCKALQDRRNGRSAA